MENKITKREMFEALVNYDNGEHMAIEREDEMVVVMLEDLKAFAENEIELLDKKSAKAKERAMAKKAEADEAIEQASKVMTIRQGDLIAIDCAVAPRKLEKEELIQIEENNEELLYCKIK